MCGEFFGFSLFYLKVKTCSEKLVPLIFMIISRCFINFLQFADVC